MAASRAEPGPGHRLQPDTVPAFVVDCLQAVRAAGQQGWIVGGAVRDLLRGVVPGEWDVAASGTPDDLMAIFPDAVPTGLRHGTVTVVTEAGTVEVTSLRGEGGYEDGRRPSEVVFDVSLEEDLARRDFTVNAMAWDPLSADSSAVDPFGGADDLRSGVLRAVGEPLDRFREDGLRALRGARFVATLGLTPEPRTAEALGSPVAGETLARVAWERRFDEMNKMLAAPRPSSGLRLLQETGLLVQVIPELLDAVGCTQNRWHAYDVWNHTLAVVDAADVAAEGDQTIRWAALLHDVGKPASRKMGKGGEPTFHGHERIGAPLAEAILERMRTSTALRRRVGRLVRHHLIAYHDGWSDAAVRRFVVRVGPDLVDDLLRLARADALGKGRPVDTELALLQELAQRVAHAREQHDAFSVRDLAVSGRDVMAATGLGAGPEVGAALRRLLDHVIARPEDNQRDTLLALLKSDGGGEDPGGGGTAV